MQSSSLKLFSSADQKPMLLKRQAFAMFSGELDQYHLYLPLIQGWVTSICDVQDLCVLAGVHEWASATEKYYILNSSY